MGFALLETCVNGPRTLSVVVTRKPRSAHGKVPRDIR